MTELLSIEGVSKSYLRGERRLRVLHDVSLTVEATEIVAVVGARFEGKSTLLRVAAGFEPPDEGSVLLDGRRLEVLSVSERERLRPGSVVWISRESNGLDLRVLDYVAVPLLLSRVRPREAESQARAMLDRVGAGDVAGLRWSELSNWERLLVSLARGTISSPRLLVIDDLFDGLGSSKTEQASDLLRALAAERVCAALVSASDVEAALGADRVFAFTRGRLRILTGAAPSHGAVVQLPHARSWPQADRR